MHIESTPQCLQSPKVNIRTGGNTRRFKNSVVGIEVQRHGASVRQISGEGNRVRLVLGAPGEAPLDFEWDVNPVGTA
ncbi:hypothetical protein LIER_34641 [Lithospermum erythrorhizon]|uniref:Uncharacterized protein n=1 Tax=Lithospermum erythrorhizon TaxID=34254 RepID=A0AAV3S078_LITER